MDYTAYSTEDFLADESFQAFVLGDDPTAATFWRDWLGRHPAREAAFHEAESVLQLLRAAPRRQVPAALQQAEIRKLWRSMQEPVGRPASWPRLRARRRLARWPALVAVVLLVGGLLAAGLSWWRRPAQLTYARYAAPPDQPRALRLPDGSRVVLRADAALTLTPTWQPGQAREVWLRGSASFEVRHLAPPAQRAVAQAADNVKFVVHTGPLDVAVLGTQFSVFSRGSRTKVVLSTGQIQLRRTAGSAPPLLMQPGELVEYDAATPAAPLVSRAVPAQLYAAWPRERLDFNDTSVADLIALLQDTYGLQITVANPRLLSQKLTGSLPTRDLDGLLVALGQTLDVRVHRQGSQVRLE